MRLRYCMGFLVVDRGLVRNFPHINPSFSAIQTPCMSMFSGIYPYQIPLTYRSDPKLDNGVPVHTPNHTALRSDPPRRRRRSTHPPPYYHPFATCTSRPPTLLQCESPLCRRRPSSYKSYGSRDRGSWPTWSAFVSCDTTGNLTFAWANSLPSL